MFQEEQTKFEECERVINLILHKLVVCIEKMENNLALLTKAYIEYANMDPLMNTLKKTFKHSSPKVFEIAKIVLVTSWIYLYTKGSVPEDFIPTVTRELFYEFKKTKEELTPDPTSVPSSTTTLYPVTWDFVLIKRDSSAFIQRFKK